MIFALDHGNENTEKVTEKTKAAASVESEVSGAKGSSRGTEK